ncbi:hypothetical protein RUND412_003651 [Rhizina undulata]
MSVGSVSERGGGPVATAGAVAETGTTSSPRDYASEVFAEAAALIPPQFHHSFTTTAILQRHLKRVQKNNGDATVRVLVNGVTEESIDKAICSLPFRSFMRVWYEQDANRAIIRIVSSSLHQMTSGEFYFLIRIRATQIPRHGSFPVKGVGLTRFTAPGRGSKEGDRGIKCSTRVGSAAWPNLMMEVGYAEPLRQLQLDAHWWLINSKGLTGMVILILVSDNPNTLYLEVWRLQPNPN